MKKLTALKSIVCLSIVAAGLSGCGDFFSVPEPEVFTGTVLEKNHSSDFTPVYVDGSNFIPLFEDNYTLIIDLNADLIGDRTIDVPKETWDLYEVGSAYSTNP